MENGKGFISLKTVSDYWNKVLFDYSNLKHNPSDVYLAFNFFVTSYHLIDWVFEGKTSKGCSERSFFEEISLIRINYHICNGAKHFEPKKNNKNNSVKEIEDTRYIDNDYCSEEYFENDILIYLEEEFVPEFGNSIEIIELADKIVSFWKKELTNRNLIS